MSQLYDELKQALEQAIEFTKIAQSYNCNKCIHKEVCHYYYYMTELHYEPLKDCFEFIDKDKVNINY